MKRLHETVGRDFPTFGDARLRLGGSFVERRQPLEESDNDAEIGVARQQMRIVIRRLLLIADEQRPRADAFFNERLALLATGTEENQSHHGGGHRWGRPAR